MYNKIRGEGARRMQRLMITFIGLVFITTSAWGYTGVQPSLSFTKDSSSLSLLDMSRVSLQNSLVFGYSSSGGIQESAGALFTTVGYTFSPRLTVHATLSKQFTFQGANDSDSGISLSGVQLNWKPADSIHLRFEFSRYPRARETDPFGYSW